MPRSLIAPVRVDAPEIVGGNNPRPRQDPRYPVMIIEEEPAVIGLAPAAPFADDFDGDEMGPLEPEEAQRLARGGDVHPLYRAPPEGRAREGGLRIQEMEREPVMAQARLPLFLRERFLNEDHQVPEATLLLLQRVFAEHLTYVRDFELRIPDLEVVDQNLKNAEGEETSDGEPWESVVVGTRPRLVLYLRVPPEHWEEVAEMAVGWGVSFEFPEHPGLNRLRWEADGVYDAEDQLISISAPLTEE